MPRHRAVLAALAVVVAVAAAGAARAEDPPSPEAAGGTSPQRLESLLPRRCGVCHLDKAPAAAAGIIAFRPPPGAAAAGAAGMCYSCHAGLVLDHRRSLWTGRHHPAGGRGVDCGSCHTPHVRERNVGAFMRHEKGTYGWCGECHGGRRPGAAGEHPSVAGAEGGRFSCGSCHTIHGATGAGLIRGESAAALCTGCHGDNPSRDGRGGGNASHPAGAAGPGCLDCHRVHGGGGRGMLARAAADGRLCRQCHEKSFSDGRGGPNHPVGAGRASCTSCHRMHNAPKAVRGRAALLAAPAAETDGLCAGCHAGQAATGVESGNHPLGVKEGEHGAVDGERLGKSGALFGPGGRLACLSCHGAHGAVPGTPQLLAPKQAVCLYCHPRQNSLDPERAAHGAHPVAERPRRARVAQAFLRAGGDVGSGGEVICSTCHRAHGAQPRTPGLVLARTDYSCLLCHTEEAAIAPTPHSTARQPGRAGGSAPGVCAGCHGEHGWRIAVPPPSGPEDRSSLVERLCRACHGAPRGAPFGGVTSHPVNIGMPPGVGADLPLFWRDGRRLRNGVLTCPTCHDVHRPGGGGRFLRAGALGKDLCVGCHPAQETVVGTRHDVERGGGSPCAVCHPVHDPTPSLTWPALRGDVPVENLDLSWFCGRCHRGDGPAAAAVVTERGHPASVAPAGAGGARPVGCAGCHEPHRWNPDDPADRPPAGRGGVTTGFLRRPVAGEKGLCGTCHPDQTAVAGTPHDFTGRPGLPDGIGDPARSGPCGSCHRVHGGDPLYLLSAPLVADRDPGRSSPCEACHAAGGMAAAKDPGDRSHPVGGSPGVDPGADLPLFGPSGRPQAAGRMGCATCHDPHRLTPPGGSGAATPAAASFLRLGADGFAPLCFPCHAEHAMVVGTDHDLRVTAPKTVNAAGRAPDSSGVCGVCHAVHRARGDFVLWNRDLGEGVDLNSRACTSCHRRGDATGARVPPRLALHEMKNPGRPSEPRVFTATRGGGEGPAALPLFMADGTRSERGYLSCASCHDVHRWETDVMSSGGGVPLEGDLTNSFLRVRTTQVADRTICRECHPHNAIELYETFHFPEGR